jgi:hypothetical protein
MAAVLLESQPQLISHQIYQGKRLANSVQINGKTLRKGEVIFILEFE